MVSTNQYLLVIVALCLFYSCQDNEYSTNTDNTSQTEENTVSVSNAIEGVVRIKLNELEVSDLSVSLKSGRPESSIDNVDQVLNSIEAISMKRTFPYAGKFEARTKEAGLHLWYDITYDTTTVDISIVVEQIAQLSEVDIIEPIRMVKTQEMGMHSVGDPIRMTRSLKTTTESVESASAFNDTYLSEQWHYDNDGTVSDAVEGADIRLYDGWLTQTGSKEVIVAIVDGGIDVDHEDLAANMWINSAEKNGVENSDEDGNGYVDDVYGYNFVSGIGTIEGHDHGTHVAGTIGAVNNNNLGVCGVAGGDETHQGVRLMSCQVFTENDRGDDVVAPSFAEAIKYGADNGAVISQNSWGYEWATKLPSAMKDAIDYFVKYAGYDENGVQTGPMAGGIVIFAAGNEETSRNVYPAMYDGVVAVAACNPDYTLSYYSNYGSWVDITAPGGSDSDHGKYGNDCYIASTASNNDYMYMFGTSMACPHVSGVAALIISEYGGPGFTPDDLKTRLYQGAIDLDPYEPDYAGELGVGLINTAGALAKDLGTTPSAVTDLKASSSSNVCTLSWTFPSNEEETTTEGFYVYYSRSSFTQDEVEAGASEITTIDVSGRGSAEGEQMTFEVEELRLAEDYYFAVVSYNLFDSKSELSDLVTVRTSTNTAPSITSLQGDVLELKSHEIIEVELLIEEPDGESYTWELSDATGNIITYENNNTVKLYINGIEYTPGTYSASFIVTDNSGASTNYAFSYTVLENTAPYAVEPTVYVYMGTTGEDSSFGLWPLIDDEDGESLQYDVSYDEELLSVLVDGDVLTIEPHSYGLTNVTVVAKDARGESCTLTVVVMMRDGTSEVDVYPNPVSDVVHVRMGEGVDGDLTVRLYNSSGILKDTFFTDISTFSPATIDLSDQAPGQYVLKMTYNSIEMERNIVKL